MTRTRHYNGYWLEGYAIIEFELFLAGSGLNFIVANDGNVGIGINPTHKLHVEGNILATCTITPDYVFENYFDGKSELNPEYEFTPLEKAEQFVKKNKHLPGVPSAANIEKQGGIIVNRATEINLEKIEELYLYVFELNQQNEQLQRQLARLEEEQNKLKKLLQPKP